MPFLTTTANASLSQKIFCGNLQVYPVQALYLQPRYPFKFINFGL